MSVIPVPSIGLIRLFHARAGAHAVGVLDGRGRLVMCAARRSWSTRALSSTACSSRMPTCTMPTSQTSVSAKLIATSSPSGTRSPWSDRRWGLSCLASLSRLVPSHAGGGRASRRLCLLPSLGGSQGKPRCKLYPRMLGLACLSSWPRFRLLLLACSHACSLACSLARLLARLLVCPCPLSTWPRACSPACFSMLGGAAPRSSSCYGAAHVRAVSCGCAS